MPQIRFNSHYALVRLSRLLLFLTLVRHKGISLIAQFEIDDEMATNAEIVRARLKWYNTTKGFGFLVPIDDPCDAFVHITTLQDAGIKMLGEDAEIICRIVKGPKGALVTQVDELIHAGNDPQPISHRLDENGEEQIDVMGGTVKWYKPDKGFGFIIPADGQKDVFVHKSCLDKNGLEILIPGQRVSMTVRTVPKGREVIEFDLIR
jgi:cold shock protein